MMDARKNLIILIFVLAGILAVLLFLNSQKLSPSGQKAQILDNQDSAAKIYPTRLSGGTVDSFGLKSGTDKIVFYEKTDSAIYEISFAGKDKKELAIIPNVSEAIFSPSGKEIIAAVPEKSILKKAYFDLQNNRRVNLHQDIKNVAFSPSGEKIVYSFQEEGKDEIGIFIARPDGSNFVNIFKTRIGSIRILWPKDETIVFYSTENTGFSIKPDGKEFKRLSQEELSSYLNLGTKEKEFLQSLEIKATNIKTSPLGDYLIFINVKDGKLYSLKNLF